MHADFETSGVIENWALENSHQLTICKPYKGDNCLKTSEYDFLILMGGPQSPLAIEKDPYLKDEIALIQQAVKHNKIILGFCLGAQLIGEALGSKTQKSPEKEVGVFPVSLTKQGMSDPLFQMMPHQFPVIHWHNDMPGLTENSEILGFSEGCPRQIIRYAPNIVGFQCHLEITLEGIKTMITACQNDLKPSRFTQTPEVLMSQDYDAINKMMYKFLDKIVQNATSDVI